MTNPINVKSLRAVQKDTFQMLFTIIGATTGFCIGDDIRSAGNTAELGKQGLQLERPAVSVCAEDEYSVSRPGLALIQIILLAILITVVAGCDNSGTSTSDDRAAPVLWQWVDKDSLVPAQRGQSQDLVLAPQIRGARLNEERLAEILSQAPMEFTAAAVSSPVEITLPIPSGELMPFSIVRSSILSPEVASLYPAIETYTASAVGMPDIVARLTRDESGIHVIIFYDGNDVVISSSDPNDPRLYETYYGNSRTAGPVELECGVEDITSVSARLVPGTISAKATVGSTLRTFRLAVAATGEYTNLFRQPGDTDAQAQARAFSRVVQMVNAVSAIYETDLAVRLQLVTGTNVIYTDPGGDPYTNGSTNPMRGENQLTLDNVNILGSANYDIGHVFGTASGGQGWPLGQVCTAGDKAKGVTGRANPNDLYDVYLVAHEMGHQFGANHTFNGTAGLPNGNADCDPNREPLSAYEPGSGSTLMSYAGGCNDPNNNQNMQINRDNYFHSRSREEILDYITAGNGTCAVQSATGNNEPGVNAGATYTIPSRTPFMLTAQASDGDGDPLTYTWEEYDLGAASPPDTDADGQARPIFRSYPPVADAARTFPSLPFILNNANIPPTYQPGTCSPSGECLVGEALPTITRTMNFRVTVRDNRAGGGGVDEDETQVNVDGASGPFAVTSPNGSLVWTAGTNQTVSWDVAGSDLQPVDAQQVNILLSTDSGQSFNDVLAGATANDGAESIVVPAISSTAARVKIESVGNIFFDISDDDFTLNLPPELTCNDMVVDTDPGQCTAMVNYNYTVTDDQPGVQVVCVPADGSALGLGENAVNCVATDVHGATSSCDFTVRVEDNEAPVLSGMMASPSLLWPPNHKMKPVLIDYSATDNCSANLQCSLEVSSNQAVNANGDGNTSPDWEIIDEHHVELRAERQGKSDGRIYTVGVTCTDEAANSSGDAVTVTVPKSMGAAQ